MLKILRLYQVCSEYMKRDLDRVDQIIDVVNHRCQSFRFKINNLSTGVILTRLVYSVTYFF